MSKRSAMLVLADGTTYRGVPFGAEGMTFGEAVFNTSMTGYQEILTDPSYRGQLVTMTSVHVGNCGVNPYDVESDAVQVAGFVMRDASRTASNFRSTQTLQEYLLDAGTIAISDVDTRAVTRQIRDGGAAMAAIVSEALDSEVADIVDKIHAAPQYEDQDFVAAVSVKSPRRVFMDATKDPYVLRHAVLADVSREWQCVGPEVAVIDYGVKRSILRHLCERGMRVTVYPHNTNAEALLSAKPAGILLSNGPGDPSRLGDAIGTVKQLLGTTPIFGICLGHQLLAHALGGETFKLKYGHRGPNQPVKVAATGRVQITAQNHGYAVKADSLDGSVAVTHTNLNDGTIEGIHAPAFKAFSAQHHPEAGPGPHDALEMFDQFKRAIE